MVEKTATLSFTPALSKRLIGQGLAAAPEVQQAYRHGRILLSSGSTTAHVYVALTGTWSGEALACGIIAGKGTCVGRAMSAFLGERGHARFWFFEKGQRIATDDLEGALESLDAGDLFIKGANALDAGGGIGILLGMESGGIIGKALGYVQARGVTFLLPGGLEKMVYGSIAETARYMGTRSVDYTERNAGWAAACSRASLLRNRSPKNPRRRGSFSFRFRWDGRRRRFGPVDHPRRGRKRGESHHAIQGTPG